MAAVELIKDEIRRALGDLVDATKPIQGIKAFLDYFDSYCDHLRGCLDHNLNLGYGVHNMARLIIEVAVHLLCERHNISTIQAGNGNYGCGVHELLGTLELGQCGNLDTESLQAASRVVRDQCQPLSLAPRHPSQPRDLAKNLLDSVSDLRIFFNSDVIQQLLQDRVIYLESCHGGRVMGCNTKGSLYLTDNRQAWERWTIRQADGDRTSVILHNAAQNRNLTISEEGVVGTSQHAGQTEHWKLVRVPGGGTDGRVFLAHTRLREQLSATDRTPAVFWKTAHRDEWEKWRVHLHRA